jgi:hypothetical protein
MFDLTLKSRTSKDEDPIWKSTKKPIRPLALQIAPLPEKSSQVIQT